ncbi:MAG: hypothetical protein HC824_19820 [Synechococcales cyanobacterium RM1_1_8]|nr:hypothetical protein [Synechococcales cyanobacterium RM1_1_8]
MTLALFGLPESTTAFLLLNLHFAIGTLAAFTAQRKGRKLSRWLVIGWIGGTPALVAALWLKPESQS